MSGPVSAFAARQSTDSTWPNVQAIADPGRLPVKEKLEAPKEGFERPRKKRKKQNGGRALEAVPSRPKGSHAQIDETETPSLDPAESPLDGRQPEKASTVEEDCFTDTSEDVLIPQEWSPAKAVANQSLSTFVPTQKNVHEDTENAWTVALGRKDTLAIVGQYDVWVRKGAVSIAGAVLHASSKLHRVYAPFIHAIPVMRPVFDPYGSGTPGTEISITSCGSGIRLLRHLSPLFRRLWNGHPSPGNMESQVTTSIQRSFGHIRTSSEDPYKRPLRPLELQQDSQALIQQLSRTEGGVEPKKVVVCGPKGSGKSTFCRLLSNATLLLTMIHRPDTAPTNFSYFLDLDPGQPEYSPPGQVSLFRIRSYNFGAPFTHPVAPPMTAESLRSHHLGYVSPRENPRHFMECASDLLQLHQRLCASKQTGPLVINSAGWIQGIGLDLLIELITRSQAIDVVYTSTTGPAEVVDALSGVCNASQSKLHEIASQPIADTIRTAPDLRAMQCLSYFHLAETEAGNLRWNQRLISEMPPLVAPYSGPKQAIFAVMLLGDQPKAEHISSVLDGSVVGLVLIENDLALSNSFTQDTSDELGEAGGGDIGRNDITDSRHPQPPPSPLRHQAVRRSVDRIPYLQTGEHCTEPFKPEYTRSLGQALVRCVDKKAQSFLLTTPVPASELQQLTQDKHKIVLVRGRLNTPTWAYKEEYEYSKLCQEQGWYSSEVSETPDDEIKLESRADGEDINGTDRWAQGQPWVSAVEGDRGDIGKARKVRRDIRYKGQMVDTL